MSERVRERRLPRLLTIMGSGETAPTMVKVHRPLLDRVGGGPAVLLDTPYGFQENADDISAKAVEYFRDERRPPTSTSPRCRSAAVDAPVERRPPWPRVARGALRVRRARAARPTRCGSGRVAACPSLLADKLAPTGGCVTFASAAALTLGRRDGARCTRSTRSASTPHWLDRARPARPATGLAGRRSSPTSTTPRAAHHDTRFCYLGERRLAAHGGRAARRRVRARRRRAHRAACSTSTPARPPCVGLGGVTVRRRGRRDRAPDRHRPWRSPTCGDGRRRRRQRRATSARQDAPSRPTVAAAAGRHAADGRGAPAGGRLRRSRWPSGDAAAAVDAVLELDRPLVEWSADTTAVRRARPRPGGAALDDRAAGRGRRGRSPRPAPRSSARSSRRCSTASGGRAAEDWPPRTARRAGRRR